MASQQEKYLWSCHVETNSGDVYYERISDGVFQWERPSEPIEAACKVQVDPVSANLRYWSLYTGKVTLVMPDELIGPDMQWIARRDHIAGGFFFNDGRGLRLAPHSLAKRLSSQRISRWIRRFDPVRRQHYFLNLLTNVATWDEPLAMIDRQREMVIGSRDKLVCGFIREHSSVGTQYPDDVIELIVLAYFPAKDPQNPLIPLLTACECGYYRVIRRLLERTHININKRNNKGMTALHLAARSGFGDICELLIEHAVDINCAAENGETALFYAADRGHVEIVEMLLQHHARTDIHAYGGSTKACPFVRACKHNHHEIAKLLLKTGTISRRNAETSLLVACVSGAFQCVHHILSAPQWPFINLQVNVNVSDVKHRAPLFIAAREGHYEIAELLLLHKAWVNVGAYCLGITPLGISARNGHIEIVRLLLTHPDVDMDCRIPAFAGTCFVTPLMEATGHGHASIVDLLLSNGADPLRFTGPGISPFHIAAQHGHYDILKRLYQHLMHTKSWPQKVAALFHREKNIEKCYTPLHLAAMGGHEDVVKYLVETAKADVCHEDFEGEDGAAARD